MEITAYNSRQHQQISLNASSMRIGRDSNLVDWAIDDPRVSDLQITIEVKKENGGEKLFVQNHGSSIILPSGRRIHGGGTCTIEPYEFFWIGETCFSVAPSTIESNCSSLSTLPPLNGRVSSDQLASVLGKSPAAITLVHWLQSIGKLQRSIGGSRQLFADAAHAAFDPGGLDCGMIISCDHGKLEIVEAFISNPDLGIGFDREVVKTCIETQQTVYHEASQFEKPACNLRTAVIAAPIFNHESELIGVVYGSRCRSKNNFRQGIRPLEAQFIQVVAECVTAGMIRLGQEADAARTRVQFEQVFSPKLVEVLQRDPSILNGHEREVTVMFCDMRASTFMAEQLSPRKWYQVLGDVMDYLTQKVLKHDGIVIDYYGDGLAAFWNAPIEQEDHAVQAVLAGIDIVESLPEFNESWRDTLGRNIQIGIGIDTGLALVGNSGSRHRMKYGPRGRCVNVAARIESQTQTFGVPMLVSEATEKLIDKRFVTRRVFRTPLKGIEEECDLFQPFNPQMDVRELERLRKYEEALRHFDQKEYIDTLEKLLEIEVEGTSDAAAEYLMLKTKEAIKTNPTGQIRIANARSAEDTTS